MNRFGKHQNVVKAEAVVGVRQSSVFLWQNNLAALFPFSRQ
jgi:hypothetical protein